MNEINSFESNLAILIDQPPSTSFQDFQSTLDDVNKFCNSIEGFIFMIKNLTNFQNIATKKVSLIVFKNWCLYKWDEVPDEYKDQLKSLLFSSIIEDFEEMPQDIQNIIGDSQFSFMWNTYPEEWPNFWEDIFKMHPYVLLNFLTAFCSYISAINYDTDETFSKIKACIRDQNADAEMVAFLFNIISDPPENLEIDIRIPFKILASLIHWIQINLILDEDAMSIIINSLNDPQTTSVSLDVLTSLIERGMESEMKMEIINSLQIPPRVIGLICNFADDTILYSAAQLIEKVGSFLISYTNSEIAPFFHISLQLLMNKDNNISSCVAPFIQQYTRNNPEVSSIVFNATYTRLKDFYLNEFLDDCSVDENPEDASYCEMLFMIIRVCFQLNHDDSLRFLLSAAEEMDVVDEMPHCIALIEILNDQQPQPEFVKYFEPLLSLEPPLSPSQTKALGCYVRFFSSVAGEFDIPTISNFFAKITEFVLSPMIKEDTRSILSFSLLCFTKKYKEISFDGSLIFSFVQTFDKNLIQIAAILISRLDENEYFEVFKSCVSHLFEKLENDPELCPLVLYFIKATNYVQGSPHIPIILDFLSQIQPSVKSDDNLQSQFIRTSFSSLGPESSDLITGCIESATERLSISAISEVATAIVKLTDDSNIEFAVNLINHLHDSFITCFNEIDDWSIVNDNTIEIIDMVDNYLSLLLVIISNVSSDFLQKMFDFISNILRSDSKYFCYQLLVKLFSFIYNASKIFPNETLQNFGALSLTCLVSNKEFKPTHPICGKVIFKMVKFHATLLELISDKAVPVIEQTFAQEGADQEIIHAYWEIFELTKRARNDKCITFFEEFMKYKKNCFY